MVISSTKFQAQKIADSEGMGIKDIQSRAGIIYSASLQNDPEVGGIPGVDAEGNPVGVVFTDPALAVLHSESTERTIITHKPRGGNKET